MYVATYKLRLRPIHVYPAELSAALLTEHLPGDASVRSLDPETGVVEVGLSHRRHQETLDNILVAAQELGYSFVEAEVVELWNRALEMALLGGGGGLAVGPSVNSNEAKVLLTLGGWIAGLFVGAMMERAEVYYVARQTPDGWKLMRISPQPRVRTAVA